MPSAPSARCGSSVSRAPAAAPSRSACTSGGWPPLALPNMTRWSPSSYNVAPRSNARSTTFRMLGWARHATGAAARPCCSFGSPRSWSTSTAWSPCTRSYPPARHWPHDRPARPCVRNRRDRHSLIPRHVTTDSAHPYQIDTTPIEAAGLPVAPKPIPAHSPRAKDTRAAAGSDHDRDAKLLGYLHELERLHPELKLNGAGDVRLALQQGRIAELRAQRDVERAFGQTRIVVIDEQLRIAAMKARRRQQQSLLLVGLLIPVAVFVVGLLYSARLGDNQVLWAIAGTTFFMSYAAIVVFAVTSLGTVARSEERRV